MRKILSLILASVLFFWFSFATNLNFEDFLVVYFEWVSINLEKNGINIGETCQNIPVKYKNVSQWSKLYQALQKWICLNIFPNIDTTLPLSNYITQDILVSLLVNPLNSKVKYSKWELIDAAWTKSLINDTVYFISNGWGINKNSNDILDDVKYRLENESIYGSGVNWDDKKCSSISGCVNLINDNYTEFYNSDQAQHLYESLEWEFSWIWAYLWTDWKWLFGITSVIEWWPAEKAGLQAWDVFLQIDNHVIWRNATMEEIRWFIKWNPWTKVKIKIQRWYDKLEFTVTRDIIYLPNVDYELWGEWICYMSIKQFNSKTLEQFEAGINKFLMDWCKAYLFDLRDNAGWELNTVVNMLNHFVNSWDTIIQMKYSDFSEDIVANWDGPKLNKKSIFIFVNEMTASASEIFAWTIKDYIKNTVLIWSKTYWKGTAQTLIQYADWSILKYTIARWFTGKSHTSVDGTWITPDVLLKENQISSFLSALRARK